MKSKPFHLVDTTLRDGMQAPGVAFSRRERVKIATALDEFGIDEIEAGVPAMGRFEIGDIKAIVKLGLRCRVTVWCRAVAEDIRLASICGADSVHISFPLSKILLTSMKKNEAWLLSACETLVPLAAGKFRFVSVGGQDVMRADPELVRTFGCTASRSGAHRLRIADTVGIATPPVVADFVRFLSVKGCPPLEFHAHNDLGMATANAFTALASGAFAASVTVNGLGERAGNAALEELAMALVLSHFKGAEGYNLMALPKLCALVAAASGRPNCRNKPVVGDGIFEHESGIHVHGLMKNPEAYQPFLPQKIGRKSFSVRIGYHSGGASIGQSLAAAGIRATREQSAFLTDRVRAFARQHKRVLTDAELRQIWNDVFGKTPQRVRSPRKAS
jgi:homocitrate synthase NifV